MHNDLQVLQVYKKLLATSALPTLSLYRVSDKCCRLAPFLALCYCRLGHPSLVMSHVGFLVLDWFGSRMSRVAQFLCLLDIDSKSVPSMAGINLWRAVQTKG